MNFFKNIFNKPKKKQPEDYFETTITEKFVRVEHPEREAEQIFWEDVNEIKFINTDQGPFAPDIWLALIGENSGCLIPHGSTGCEKVYDIVSKFENFNFENVIRSMSSCANEEFVVWKRT
ncbi:hypothetical protein [Flavobacterium humi]|uniref:Uncharacterized protein n=1 Tax=Flavobacterium humi TaxID=2562683 RepID=A0A4Z0LD27_9FLAO|nr:hypothetical protein [Flavobacterium humi]TGD59799.1 hypothetical protein E4635_02395 [Flavobacterium humi]